MNWLENLGFWVSITSVFLTLSFLIFGMDLLAVIGLEFGFFGIALDMIGDYLW